MGCAERLAGEGGRPALLAVSEERPALSEGHAGMVAHAVETVHDVSASLEKAKEATALDALEGRLSWHSLRHSAGSIWLTEYGIPVTTVSAMMGHANPSFTLACYGRDPRDEQTMVADVLARAAAATS